MTARDAQQGIELFRRERPQVTILDVEMPDMDGLAVPREIRAVDPQAPVIMLTGAGSDEREMQARGLGVTEFLANGCSLHERGAALNLVVLPPVKTVLRVVTMREEPHAHPFCLNTFAGGCCHDE